MRSCALFDVLALTMPFLVVIATCAFSVQLRALGPLLALLLTFSLTSSPLVMQAKLEAVLPLGMVLFALSARLRALLLLRLQRHAPRARPPRVLVGARLRRSSVPPRRTTAGVSEMPSWRSAGPGPPSGMLAVAWPSLLPSLIG